MLQTKNDFELKRAGSDIPKNREVWTNGCSILVKMGKLKDFIEKVGE